LNKWLVISLIMLLIGGIGYYFLTRPPYNRSVSIYNWQYESYLSEESMENWKERFPETIGKNYTELLEWINTKMKYPSDQVEADKVTVLRWIRGQKGTTNDPIAIIEGNREYASIDGRTLGRCGEFSLSFLQSLFVNKYKVNLLMGLHTLEDGAIGDHVWIELDINDKLLIIDPTDACTWRDNNSSLSWAECSHIGYGPRLVQNVTWNEVWRITVEEVFNVTEEYN